MQSYKDLGVARTLSTTHAINNYSLNTISYGIAFFTNA
jgi:hypothetical protein